MPEREKNIPVTTFLSKTSTQLVILMLLTGLTFFTNLSAVEPTLMESRNFITAREMTQQQNWLLPTMNGELRLAKPPLPTWLTALAGLSAGDMGGPGGVALSGCRDIGPGGADAVSARPFAHPRPHGAFSRGGNTYYFLPVRTPRASGHLGCLLSLLYAGGHLAICERV